MTKTYTSNLPVPGNYFTTNPGQNGGTFSLNTTVNSTDGPLSYWLADQMTGSPPWLNFLGADTYYNGGCNQSCVGGAPPSKGPVVFPGPWTTGVPFSFNVAFAGPWVGSTTNQAGAHWIDYSGYGKPPYCPNPVPNADGKNHPGCTATASLTLQQISGISGAYFNTTGGNVHAGDTVSASGGSCTSANPSANIKSNSGASGTYLVTATGTNNVPSTSGTGLSQGSNGVIGCRPDLVKAAHDYPDHQNAISHSLNPFNFSGVNHKVVDSTGDTHLGVPGQPICIQNQTTLHVISGSLYIDGDVLPAGSAGCPAASGSPSFGVVVDQNIYISPKVHTLFGYYYTAATAGNGIVFTCATGPGSPLPGQPGFDATNSPTGCGSLLTIRGLLMAKTIHFERTAVGGPSEEFDYTGQVYAAPPPAFSTLFTDFGPPNSLELLPPRY